MWDGGPIPGELGRFPGYLMARLGEASRRRFHRALEPEGLHPRDFGVMTMVGAHPGMSQQQLHEKTGIDPSSMVAVIDMLEARGFAERRSDPDDRRARAIFLTDEGERTLERIRELAGELQRELFGVLTDDELGTLHGLLRKLADSAGKTREQPARSR
jgi:DNA-binding MarR family transcriptional regulator